ncbi:hamartin-like isoform X2 [Lineus longissimus]|uniref:hamartin-like isoform X2 n=1 Tax=Lineus longissimus TaxID=88925 RepID=UPI002B4D5A78
MSLQQQQVDASELFNLLESKELKVVEDIKALIHENLNSAREAWLLNGLVEYYMVTQSDNSLEILAGLREPHDKHLFDKLNDYMKGPTRVSTLTAIGFIVRKQPSWLHKIVNHHLFTTIIKCLKTDTDVPILMSACLIITTLLPVIPVSIGSHLQDIFIVFTRLAAFSLKKPANVPDIFLLHLQVGVYALFHRLYGMYPCNFLAFLRSYYSKKDHTVAQVFEQRIKPMLERVRMHPQLVTSSKEKEMSTSRWKSMEIHDITIECAKMSLDMIEGTAEGHRRPLFGKRTSIDSMFLMEAPTTPLDTQTQSFFSHHQPYQSVHVRDHEASDQYSLVNQLKCSSTDLWSPSSVCGMMTPPLSQQVTPSQSVSDLNTASITSHQGLHAETPTIPTPTMRHSPPYEDSGNYGNAKGIVGKRRSVPVGHPTPPCSNQQCAIHSPGLDVSPMKRDFTSEPPNQAKKMVAKKLLLPCDKALETSKTFDPSTDVSLKLNRSISEHGSKKEICDTTKAAEKEIIVTDSGKSPTLHPSHSMPNIVDQSDCDVSTASEDFQTASELSLNGDHSVPLEMLPNLIKRLSEADSEDISHVHDADDDEVSDINGSHISITIDHEPYDHSAKMNDPQLTAQSMQQFMKNVNRIRFNSMNTNNDSTLKRSVKKGKLVRSSSCPDLKSKMEIADAIEDSFDEEVENNDESRVTKSDSKGTTTINQSLLSPFPGSVAVTCESTTVTHSTTVHCIYPKMAAGVVQSLPHMQHHLQPPPQCPPFINTSQTDQLDQMPVRRFPYEDLLTLSLPLTPITQCQNCMDRSYVPSDSHNQPHLSTTSPPRVLGCEVPLFTSLSPPDLLDRQIQLGGEVHAKELSHIPLTSGESISWTHFGGVPPTDEVNILRGQNMLLHTQMMYERHKREQHALRNRRLLGKIVKNVALEEQNSAMRDQLQLQEKDIEQLQVALKLQREENRRISDGKKVMELEKESELVKLRRSEEELEYKTKELQSMLVTEKDEKKIMLQELQTARSDLFNLRKEMGIIESKVALTNELQEQVKHLNKELLLMGELQKKYREKMAALSKNDTRGYGQKQIIEAYKSEIEALKSSQDQVLIHSESLKTRVADLEEVIKNKDVVIKDQKRSLEKVKNVYTSKLECVNDKYRGQQSVIQRLEAHVLELHHKYSRNHRRHSSHRSPHGSSLSQDTSRETSPEQKTNGVSHTTRPITVEQNSSLDQLDSSHREFDSSNNAQAPSVSNDYLTRSITTDGKNAFQKYKPHEISSYPQYSKPLYANFTCASEGQRYESMDQPSFLMPYDSVVKPPDDLEASAAESDLNFMMSTEREDFTSASASNAHAQDGGASLNVDSGIVSHM